MGNRKEYCEPGFTSLMPEKRSMSWTWGNIGGKGSMGPAYPDLVYTVFSASSWNIMEIPVSQQIVINEVGQWVNKYFYCP